MRAVVARNFKGSSTCGLFDAETAETVNAESPAEHTRSSGKRIPGSNRNLV